MIPRPILRGLAITAAAVALFALGWEHPVVGVTVVACTLVAGALAAKRAWERGL